MNIISALMKVGGIRLYYGNKWLVYSGNEYGSEWTVYQHKYKAKKSTVLIKTQMQEEAIKVLCDDES